MVFGIDDLMKIRNYPYVKDQLGTLHKAEMLVDELDFRNGYVDTNQTDYPGKNSWMGEYFLRGKLSNEVNVRTVKELIYARFNPDESPPEHWGDLVMDELNIPNKEDIVGVYWFSQGEFPKRFRGETYVRVLNKGDKILSNPIFRTENSNRADYLVQFGSVMPRQSNKTIVESDTYWKDMRKQDRNAMKKVLGKDYFFSDDLQNMSEEEIKSYIAATSLIPENVLNKLENNKDRLVDYKKSLITLALFDPERVTLGLLGDHKFSDYCIMIEQYFPDQIRDFIDIMLDHQSRGEKIKTDDILHQLGQALYSTFGFAFSSSVPVTLEGCFGRSDRKR